MITDDDGADLIRDFRDLPNGQDNWGEPCANGDEAWNERRKKETDNQSPKVRP